MDHMSVRVNFDDQVTHDNWHKQVLLHVNWIKYVKYHND